MLIRISGHAFDAIWLFSVSKKYTIAILNMVCVGVCVRGF